MTFLLLTNELIAALPMIISIFMSSCRLSGNFKTVLYSYSKGNTSKLIRFAEGVGLEPRFQAQSLWRGCQDFTTTGEIGRYPSNTELILMATGGKGNLFQQILEPELKY